MRWVVELPAPSGGTAATVTVDADSWAGALTHARGGSPIKKFRCEFDADNVVRVLDLGTRDWYTIRPIRSVAPEPAPPPAEAAPVAAPERPETLAENPPTGSVSTDAAPPSPVASATSAEATPEATAPAAPTESPVAAPAASPAEDAPPSAPARPHDTLFGVPPPRNDESRLVAVDESGEHQALPGGASPPTLLFERDQDPSETNPLTYRERVFAVTEGTSTSDAEQVARQALAALRRALATRPRGRYVVVAVFDHAFAVRPERPALVELRWKDWRGEPELTLPAASVSSPVNGVAAAPVEPVVIAVTPPPQAAPVSADVSGSVDASAAVLAASEPDSAAPAATESLELRAEPAAAADAAREEASTTTADHAAPEASTAAETPASGDTSAAFVVAAVEAPATETPLTAEAATASTPATEEASAPVAESPAAVAVVVVSEPVVTEPAATGSAVTEPAVTEPAVTEPAVTEPAVTEPAVTEPAATEPVVVASNEASPPSAPASVEVSSVVVSDSLVPTLPPPAGVPSSDEASAIVIPAAPSPPARSPRAARTLSRRLRGKDLLSELFDALMDLSHMASTEAGCKHVAEILLEHVQCDLAVVSIYDINRDEFVVSSALGIEGLDGRRERAGAGAAATVVKRKASTMVGSVGGDDALHDDLRDGGALYAPAMFRERLFALVRVHRVPGAEAFGADELDAVTYVAGQLGEFLSTQSKRAAAAEFAPEPSRRTSVPPRR